MRHALRVWPEALVPTPSSPLLSMDCKKFPHRAVREYGKPLVLTSSTRLSHTLPAHATHRLMVAVLLLNIMIALMVR